MLRVVFEIVPFGIEDHENRRVIGELRIGLMEVERNIGKYVSALHSDAKYPPLHKVVAVENDRTTGAWPLVQKALEKHCDPAYDPAGQDGVGLPDGETKSRPVKPKRSRAARRL